MVSVELVYDPDCPNTIDARTHLMKEAPPRTGLVRNRADDAALARALDRRRACAASRSRLWLTDDLGRWARCRWRRAWRLALLSNLPQR